MDNEVLGHLFLSYSHTDKPYMLMFRKHLGGMLLNKNVQVWSDQDISKGTGWESFLMGNVAQASSALVLATPDYLISPWCRLELKQLAAASRAGNLRNLFWVELRPCGWQHTELADFQALERNGEQTITELPDETHRERAVLQACEQIALQIRRSIKEDDRHLASMRRLLLDTEDAHNLTVNKVLHAGPFSIVCRGLSGTTEAAIKVLRRAPLEKMSEDFMTIGKERMKLRDPSFVRIHKIFQVGTEVEQRTIIVSDFVNDANLLSVFLEEHKAIAIDKAAALLRRTAEGLTELHKASGVHKPESEVCKDQWRWTLGLLTPDDIYYDQPAERLRMPAIGVSSFLWHVLDWATYKDWVDPNAEFYVAPEQRNTDRQHLTPKTDQYMLARLGVELLEGRHFKQILERKSESVADFWKDPGGFIEGDWRKDHGQFWSILSRMLKEQSSERYDSMDEVVRRLCALEEGGRALAKRVYYLPRDTSAEDTVALKDNEEFFRRFYETFFRASPESIERFKKLEEQHSKLMKSIAAVLNFREGNEPTSLAQFLEVHKGKNITSAEFVKFHESFLDTMDRFTNRDQKVRKAWDDLFKPAVEYMIRECVTDRPEPDSVPADGVTVTKCSDTK
jgi:serine/threonine protein kinase